MDLQKLPISREGIEVFASQMINDILYGRIDLKSLLYQKKVIEMTLEQIFDNEEVKDLCIETIEQYGKEGVGYAGARMEVMSRKTWDYSNTGDAKIAELMGKQELLKKQITARQKLLQTIPSKGVADTETGEIVYPASYTSKDYIKITLK